MQGCVMVEKISAKQTYHLRHLVLRPHQPIEQCRYPFDNAPMSVHLGIRQEAILVGVASLLAEQEAPPLIYRLRGMAIIEGMQGKGWGSKLMARCLLEAEALGAHSIWANVRLSAVGFYHKHGFERRSEDFDISGIGPHAVYGINLP